MPDAHDLRRFVGAQEPVYADVTAELRAGRKRSHWMWFIFPQISGLGRSGTARFYAISSLEEARAYLDHSVLGPRLRQCTELALAIVGRSAHDVFGSPDDLKFRSSMTLFAEVGTDGEPFGPALEKFFGGEPDPLTLDILRRAAG